MRYLVMPALPLLKSNSNIASFVADEILSNRSFAFLITSSDFLRSVKSKPPNRHFRPSYSIANDWYNSVLSFSSKTQPQSPEIFFEDSINSDADLFFLILIKRSNGVIWLISWLLYPVTSSKFSFHFKNFPDSHRDKIFQVDYRFWE
jgi:hypothetical protein